MGIKTSQKPLDSDVSIVLAKSDMDVVKRARRWLHGAAMLLAEASNGDSVIDQIAKEASTLACVTEIIIFDRENQQ